MNTISRFPGAVVPFARRAVPLLELLAVAVIFLLPWLFNLQLGNGAVLIRVLAVAIVGVSLLAGLAFGFPNWTLPLTGAILIAVSFYFVASWLDQVARNMPFFRELGLIESMNGRLLGGFFLYGLFFMLYLLIVGIILMLARLIHLRPRWWVHRHDWTEVSFLFYGANIALVILEFDEYRHEGWTLFVVAIFLTIGAVVYLRSQLLYQRILALVFATTLAWMAAGVGKFMILPLQDWPWWFDRHDPKVERGFEFFSVMIPMAWVLITLLVSTLLPYGRKKAVPSP